jgi:putative membrane protein
MKIRKSMKETNASDVVKGAVAGLIGGIVASFVMSQFQTLLSTMSEEEKKLKKKKEDEPANVKTAEAISENVFDHKLKKSEKEPAGEAVHYAMGATSGLIYGIASEIAPITTVGLGLPFGAAVWLVADDVVVPALGLAKPANEYPLSAHAYALSSHLVYGLTTDLVRRAVRDLLD